MKKIEYMKPEVKAYNVKMRNTILVGSDGTSGNAGLDEEITGGDPD